MWANFWIQIYIFSEGFEAKRGFYTQFEAHSMSLKVNEIVSQILYRDYATKKKYIFHLGGL